MIQSLSYFGGGQTFSFDSKYSPTVWTSLLFLEMVLQNRGGSIIRKELYKKRSTYLDVGGVAKGTAGTAGSQIVQFKSGPGTYSLVIWGIT